jgi:hypothetical protein
MGKEASILLFIYIFAIDYYKSLHCSFVKLAG